MSTLKVYQVGHEAFNLKQQHRGIRGFREVSKYLIDDEYSKNEKDKYFRFKLLKV